MSVRWYVSSGWRRTRYYWPAARARKRTAERLREDYARYGFEWSPPWPWWWPFYRWPFPQKPLAPVGVVPQEGPK